MQKGKIYYQGNAVLDAVKTNNSFERMRGLLFKTKLSANQALLIDRCNSIHTIGMTYNIDIIYLDRKKIIKKIVSNFKPWRMSFCWQANETLELLGNMSNILNFKVGEKIEWKEH